MPDTKDLSLAFKTIVGLRNAGLACDLDFMGRSFKAQMKQANRENAKFTLIFGEDELSRQAVAVRNMADSSQTEVKLTDLLTILKGHEVQGK